MSLITWSKSRECVSEAAAAALLINTSLHDRVRKSIHVSEFEFEYHQIRRIDFFMLFGILGFEKFDR